MAKRLNRKNWRTWEVDGRIPEDVLELMVAKPGFDVNYVYEAATSQLERMLWGYVMEGRPMLHPVAYRELQIEHMKSAIEHLPADPAGVSVYHLGGILESAFIIKMIDERLDDWEDYFEQQGAPCPWKTT